MAHNTQLSAAQGLGDLVTNYHIEAGGAYPTTGKVQAFVLYASANSSSPPTVFTLGAKTSVNSLGVVLASDQAALPITDGGGSLTVDGTVAVTQSGAWSTAITGTVTTSGVVTNAGTFAVQATQAGTWNVGTVTTITNVVHIDDNAGSLTVDGTVAISGTVTVGTHAVTQSGTWTMQPGNTPNTVPWLATIHDGTRAASVRDTGTSDSLNVAITDAAGNQITTFGGGTEYTEGAVDSTITGSAMLWEDTADTLRTVSAAKPLPVNIVSGAGSGGTSSVDNAAFVADAGSGTPMMGIVSTSAVTAGRVGVVAMLANRQQKVTLYDSGGTEITSFGGGAGGTQYDEDTVAVTGDKLTMAGAVRQDTPVASVDADGDRAALKVDALGRLWTKTFDDIVTGTITANGQTVVLPLNGHGSAVIQIAGTWNGTIQFEVSGDGSTYVSANGSTPAGSLVTSAPSGTNGIWIVGVAGYHSLRVRCSAYVSGTAVITLRAAAASQSAMLQGPLPTGSNSIGSVSSVASIAAITPGTLATNLGKAEDAVHATGDVGVAVWAVRRDTPIVSGTTDGDYSTFNVDASGRLYVNAVDDTIFADDAAFVVGTSKVGAAGYLADETATDVVDEGDIGIARITLDRKQIVTTYAHAAGGATPGKVISAASTNATSIKASPGTLYNLVGMNLNAAARFVKLFNKASAPVPGTDVPVQVYMLPGSTTGAGFVIPLPACGLEFSTGIALALTTGIQDSDTGAVAANEICVSWGYK